MKKLYTLKFYPHHGAAKYPFGYSFDKHIGDQHGSGGPASNEAEMLQSLNWYVLTCTAWDSIVQRQVDLPNEQNTELIIGEGVALTRRQVWHTIKTTIASTRFASQKNTLESFFVETT